jgi:hypothetical protein
MDATMRAADPLLFATALTYFPSDAVTGAAPRLFRLTRNQLDATTQSLLPAQYTATVAETMPRDPLQTNYEYAENLSFNPANFTPYVDWIDKLAGGVRTQPASVIDCAALSNSASCLEQQAQRFVLKAFRGVVDQADLARYSLFYQSSVTEVGMADATADLVALTLTSPHYVFRDEVARGALSPAQQLQSITYTLADAPPEALGLSSANASASLGTPAALQGTVEQVLRTPAARDKLLRFFLAWLEVKEPAEFVIASDVFPEFTPAVATAAVAETRAFLNQQLSAATPKLTAITQSTQSFVSDALAAIYGLPRGSATGPVNLDPAQRLGIFTQPAVIASHSGPTTTRLVKRGVFFTRKLMCLPLGQPPPGVNTTLPVTAGASERQRVEQATSSAQCQGCHAVINPFGFMQENYDAIGRWRTTDQGQPVDASMKFDLLDEGPLATSSPITAFKTLTSSLRFQQCFARQLFRFYMGREEQPTDDPVLRQMFFGFAEKGEQDISGMLQTLVRSPSFALRRETP